MKYTEFDIWFVIIISGIITFFIRFSFIQFMKSDVRAEIKEFLSFIPPAVLSALVFYGVFNKGIDSLFLTNHRIWAALTAFLFALKFKNMLLTIFSGMFVIWVLNFI